MSNKSTWAFLMSVLSFGPISAQGSPLSPYPFAKSQFDGGFTFLASQNSGGHPAIAARTLLVTQELKDHIGSFQIDLVATFRKADGFSTINAANASTASFYVSSSSSDYFSSSPRGSGTELFELNLADFVDANRVPLQTYSTQGGTQFLPTLDLGLSYENIPILALSSFTNIDQSLKLRNWISTLTVGTTAIFGISFDLNATDGWFSLVSTDDYLGNNVAADGIIFTSPDESLGFALTPIVVPKPTLSITVFTPTAQLLMTNLFPGQSYRVAESDDLAGWTQLHSFTAPASSPPATPIDPVSFLLTTPINPSGKRFYRLEWNK